MDDLLQEMMGGTQPRPEPGKGSSDMLSELLGGLLGGGGAGGTGGLGGLLEGLLGGAMGQGGGMPGGGMQPGTGGMEDIPGAILGGGGGGTGMGTGSNSLLAPLVEGIAQKLKLPPQLVQIVVTFVLGKLLGGSMGAGAQPQQESQAWPRPGQDQPPAQEGLNLDGLLDQMRSGAGVQSRTLAASGLTDELVQQTGMDPETAERALSEVFAALGSQMGAAQRPGGAAQVPPSGPPGSTAKRPKSGGTKKSTSTGPKSGGAKGSTGSSKPKAGGTAGTTRRRTPRPDAEEGSSGGSAPQQGGLEKLLDDWK